MPLVDAAVAITDSSRPVLGTIRSKLVGSIEGYDEAETRRELGESESENRDKRGKKKLIKY